MGERSRSGTVIVTSILIGLAVGALVQVFTPWLGDFLGISPVAVFGIGLGIVEGPTLISAIVLARRVTRVWVRSALQAGAPFLGFFAYLVSYGILRHPPFAFPFPF
ncbi:MAG TPA: hypothetical protein VFG07_09290 [Thermoplasmata archaeon]|nr:hypothetical protein [Thermoplasmata archaeon]